MCNGYGMRYAAPASYNAAFLMLCCFVLPSLSRDIVCVLGDWDWQESDVDCLLLSCFACAYPFSLAYRHWPVCLDWRALMYLTLAKITEGRFTRNLDSCKLNLHPEKFLTQRFWNITRQQSYVQKKLWEKQGINSHTVDSLAVMVFTRIYTKVFQVGVFQHWAS